MSQREIVQLATTDLHDVTEPVGPRRKKAKRELSSFRGLTQRESDLARLLMTRYNHWSGQAGLFLDDRGMDTNDPPHRLESGAKAAAFAESLELLWAAVGRADRAEYWRAQQHVLQERNADEAALLRTRALNRQPGNSGREHTYTIQVVPDRSSGGYTVTVPALPGCVTQGETHEEAIAMARDAIQGYIEALTKDGLLIPEERERPQMLTVRVAA